MIIPSFTIVSFALVKLKQLLINQREVLVLGFLLGLGVFALTLPYRLNPERMFGPHTDLTQAFYVNFSILRDSILQNHRLPFWDNSILAGRPIFENPLFLAFYPLTYLILISKTLAMGIFILMLLHLFLFAFLTAYLVGKKIFQISFLSQIFLGFAALLLPKAFIYWTIGHVFTVFFLPFLPLIFYSVCRLVERKNFLWGVITGSAWALAFIVDVRMSSYLLFVLGVFCAIFIFSQKLTIEQSLKTLLRLFLVVIVFLIIISIPFFFFSKLTSLSTRTFLDLQSARAGGVTSLDLLRFFFPNVSFDPRSESFFYPGLAVILLSIYLLLNKVARQAYGRYITSLIPALILILIFSLDFSTKFLGAVSWLPILTLFRVPSRTFLIIDWFLVVLASLGFWQLVSWWQKNVRGFSSNLLGAILIIFLILDLANFDLAFIYSQGPYDKNPQYRIINKIKSYVGTFRVFSVDHSLDQKLAYESGLKLVDGEDPFQLENFINFSDKLLGLDESSYAVSFPPSQIYATRQITPNPLYLSLLNIKFVVSKSPLSGADHLILVDNFNDNFYLYEFKSPLPRVYLSFNWNVSPDALFTMMKNSSVDKIKKIVYLQQREVESLGLSTNYRERSFSSLDSYKEVYIQSYRPDEIVAKTESAKDSILVLNEIFYPGWRVKVDGQEKQIISVNDVLRGVFLPAGQHEAVFSYQPFSDLGSIVKPITKP